jgi:hypothetical protein
MTRGFKCKRPPTEAAYLCNLCIDPFCENLAARLSCTLAVIPFFSSQRRQIANCLNSFLAWPIGNMRARRSASPACLLTTEIATPFGCFMAAPMLMADQGFGPALFTDC